MRPWAVAAVLLTLGACARPAEAPVTYLSLDCAQPFEAQVAAIRGQAHLNPAPDDPAEPYSFMSSADVLTTGCPYGDKKGYDQLHAYLDGLKHWTRR